MRLANEGVDRLAYVRHRADKEKKTGVKSTGQKKNAKLTLRDETIPIVC